MNQQPDTDPTTQITILMAIATLTEKVGNLEKRIDRGNSYWPIVLSAIAVLVSVISKIPWVN